MAPQILTNRQIVLIIFTHHLILGDSYSASFLQLKARNIKSVVNSSKELHGFSKEVTKVNSIHLKQFSVTKDQMKAINKVEKERSRDKKITLSLLGTLDIEKIKIPDNMI